MDKAGISNAMKSSGLIDRIRDIYGKIMSKDGKPLKPVIHNVNIGKNRDRRTMGRNIDVSQTRVSSEAHGHRVSPANPNMENQNPNLEGSGSKDTLQANMVESLHANMKNDSEFWNGSSLYIAEVNDNPNLDGADVMQPDVHEPNSVGVNKTSNACNSPSITLLEKLSSPGKGSFVNVLSGSKPSPKINFRVLINEEKVENSDFVLPIENVIAAKDKFANSLVGSFIGKRVAFPIVKNYVTNTWAMFGFQNVIKDDEDVYYFKFTSARGLEQVIKQGPWLIRNQPLMLTKWTPNLNIDKDSVSKVPVWVKIHKVPVVAYSEDGLSLIGTQLGKPIMLDAFTSSMCAEPWVV
nr:hypothetical protein [Tanacetum cinerariifolium]